MNRALVTAVLWTIAPVFAEAHARPAALTSVHRRPGGDLVATATWGLAFRDGGQWSLGCAAAYGVDADIEDALLVVDEEGTLVLGTFDGLFESPDGCFFTRAPGSLGEEWVVGLTVDPEGVVYAGLTRLGADDQLYRRDAGGLWEATGEPLEPLLGDLHAEAADDLWLTSFYPRTAEGPPRVFLERSRDGGATRTRWELPLLESEYGATILASRRGVVHLAVRHFDGELQPERLLRFDGEREVFESVHTMVQMEQGLWTDRGLSVIGRAGGVDRSVDGRTFARVYEVAGRCLVELEGQLVACTDPARDGMALGALSEAVEPRLQLAQLSALRACSPSSRSGAECPAFREALAEDVQVAVDGVPPPGTAAASDGGCAVSATERAPGAEGALAVAWLIAQRRRRRKTSARPMRPAP